MTTITHLDTTVLDRITRGLGKNKRTVGRMLGLRVEARAKQKAPFDTTALRQSIYTVTQDSDDYRSASRVVDKLREGAETEPHPTPTGNVLANVGPCVEYAAYVELGTSKMAARPFLVPALEEETAIFNEGTWAVLFE